MFSNGVIYPNQQPSNGMTQYGPGGIGYPMGYDQPVPMPGISAGGKGGGKGGSDPYSQVMGQMGGGDPYSQIMGQTPDFQDPYARSSYGPSGGYDPRIYNNAFAGSNSRLNLGGGGGGDYTPTPSDWSNKTDAEKAAYYAANPTMATITQLGQKGFGFTSLGALQRAMFPGFVNEQSLIAMGVDPAAYQSARESFRASEIAAMNAGYPSAIDQNAQAMQSMQDAYNADMAAASGGFDGYSGGYAGTSSDTGVGNPGESDSGGYGGYGGTSSDTGSGNPGESGSSDSSSSDSSSSDSSSDSGGDSGGGDGYANGGKVTKDRLKGPDPKGPDEGYGALLSGEYVIKKSAVKKYGAGLLDMINAGKIPAKKMKSLLG
jgi:hypothetical protein